jgi:hypothetical protein
VNSLGKIDLKLYAREIVRTYRNEILNTRKSLGLKSKQKRLYKSDEVIRREDFDDIKEFRKIFSKSFSNFNSLPNLLIKKLNRFILYKSNFYLSLRKLQIF